jgi:hypothetical protein
MSLSRLRSKVADWLRSALPAAWKRRDGSNHTRYHPGTLFDEPVFFFSFMFSEIASVSGGRNAFFVSLNNTGPYEKLTFVCSLS